MSAPRLNATLRRCARRLAGWGWPGLLGSALALCAVGVETVWRPALEQERLELSAQNAARAQQVRALMHRRSTPANAQDRLREFTDTLPSPADLDARLGRWFELLQARPLSFTHAALRQTPGTSGSIDELHLTISLHGAYGDVRAFIETALRADPALGLDGVQVRRATPADSQVDAETSWTFVSHASIPPSARHQPPDETSVPVVAKRPPPP
jgi:plasmid stability protein